MILIVSVIMYWSVLCVGGVLHTSLSGVIWKCGAGVGPVLLMLIVSACLFVCLKFFLNLSLWFISNGDELNVRGHHRFTFYNHPPVIPFVYLLLYNNTELFSLFLLIFTNKNTPSFLFKWANSYFPPWCYVQKFMYFLLQVKHILQ